MGAVLVTGRFYRGLRATGTARGEEGGLVQHLYSVSFELSYPGTAPAAPAALAN